VISLLLTHQVLGAEDKFYINKLTIVKFPKPQQTITNLQSSSPPITYCKVLVRCRFIVVKK
jgi:hypothetical protein